MAIFKRENWPGRQSLGSKTDPRGGVACNTQGTPFASGVGELQAYARRCLFWGFHVFCGLLCISVDVVDFVDLWI